jgi:hypothetical protein
MDSHVVDPITSKIQIEDSRGVVGPAPLPSKKILRSKSRRRHRRDSSSNNSQSIVYYQQCT